MKDEFERAKSWKDWQGNTFTLKECWAGTAQAMPNVGWWAVRTRMLLHDLRAWVVARSPRQRCCRCAAVDGWNRSCEGAVHRPLDYCA